MEVATPKRTYAPGGGGRLHFGALILALVASVAVLAPAAAQETDTWDHAGQCGVNATATSAGCSPILHVTAAPGDAIRLTINNTCPADFEYTLVRIPLPPDRAGRMQGPGTACTATRTVEFTHEARYAGYVVHMVRKAGTTPGAGDARVTIAVTKSEWKLRFGGGFTGTGLVDPEFALRPVD